MGGGLLAAGLSTSLETDVPTDSVLLDTAETAPLIVDAVVNTKPVLWERGGGSHTASEVESPCLITAPP